MDSNSLAGVFIKGQLTPEAILDAVYLTSIQRISAGHLDRESPLQDHACPGAAATGDGCYSQRLQPKSLRGTRFKELTGSRICALTFRENFRPSSE